MMKWLVFSGAAVSLAALSAFLLGAGSGALMAGYQPDLARGEAIYSEACAACHGANLEGEANWRSPGPDGRLPAPPHDQSGHTWHHPDQVLFSYTKLGGRALMAEQGMEFDSGMPGFGEQLTDQEIWNILGYIKSTWPERIRETQAVRTEGEARSRENK